MNILKFIFTTNIGWTLIALLSIFGLVYFEAPKWLFLIPIVWIGYVFIIGTISGLKNLFKK